MKILRPFRVALVLAILPVLSTGCWTTGSSPEYLAFSREQERRQSERIKEEQARAREKKYWEEYDAQRRRDEEKARVARLKEKKKKEDKAHRRFADEAKVAGFIVHGKIPDVRKKTAREIAVDQARRASMTAARDASISAAQTAAKTAVKTGAKDGAKKAASTAAKPAPSAHPPAHPH